jgi:ribosomal protein S18 acetylase RimI-like enzyme
MAPSNATVRRARLSDAAGIARVHVDAWRETYTGMVPEHFFDEAAFERRTRYWAGYLSMTPEPGTLFVAERDDHIVGFANSGKARGPDAEKGFEPSRPLHLFSIYVLAADHGSGAGQDLLNAVLGDQPAQLWVASANARARRFYERNGFKTDGIEFVDPDIDGLVEIRMVR